MKTMRRALRNGLWSGGIVLALAYLLVLQSLLAGLAQGALAAASTGPLAVICTPSGLVTLDPSRDGEIPGKELLHWHCAAFCQSASAGTPVLPGTQTGFVSAPRQQIVAIASTPADIAQSAFIGSIAEARAPPSSI
jgi:hypothetical protein